MRSPWPPTSMRLILLISLELIMASEEFYALLLWYVECFSMELSMGFPALRNLVLKKTIKSKMIWIEFFQSKYLYYIHSYCSDDYFYKGSFQYDCFSNELFSDLKLTSEETNYFASFSQIGFPIGGLLCGVMVTLMGKRFSCLFGLAFSYILGR